MFIDTTHAVRLELLRSVMFPAVCRVEAITVRSSGAGVLLETAVYKHFVPPGQSGVVGDKR